MKLVYATGAPRRMEFGTVSSHVLLPPGAAVYAVCEGERTTRHLDEETFDRMTDEEFFTFQSLVADARISEARRARLRPSGTTLGRLIRLLFGRRAGDARRAPRVRADAPLGQNL